MRRTVGALESRLASVGSQAASSPPISPRALASASSFPARALSPVRCCPSHHGRAAGALVRWHDMSNSLPGIH